MSDNGTTARDVIERALTKRHEELSGEASARDFDGARQILGALVAEGYSITKPTSQTNDTYIVDDGDGPELWRRTEGENTQDELLLTKGDVRASVYHHMTIGGHKAIADVDRLWDAIAATAGEAPKDGDDA